MVVVGGHVGVKDERDAYMNFKRKTQREESIGDMIYPPVHPFPSTYPRRAHGGASKAGCRRHPSPRPRFLLRDPEALPGQMGYALPPAISGSDSKVSSTLGLPGKPPQVV